MNSQVIEFPFKYGPQSVKAMMALALANSPHVSGRYPALKLSQDFEGNRSISFAVYNSPVCVRANLHAAKNGMVLRLKMTNSDDNELCRNEALRVICEVMAEVASLWAVRTLMKKVKLTVAVGHKHLAYR